MAILAASLFLAFAARTGAISTAPILSMTRYSQAGKTGVGNNDLPLLSRRRYRQTIRRFFLLPPYGWRCSKF